MARKKIPVAMGRKLGDLIRAGDLPAVRKMLDDGISVDADLQRRTPLVVAIGAERPAMIRELIRRKADVNLRSDGMTPLMWACEWGQTKTAQLLMKHGADPNLRLLRARDGDEAGMTALMYAAGRGHRDLVQVLIEAGAEVSAVTEGGWSALNVACEYGRYEIAKDLIASGCPVLADVLRWPVVENNLEMVKLLIRSGADVEVVPRDFPRHSRVYPLKIKSLLGNAACSGSTEAALDLIKTGADVNRQVENFSPLGWAVQTNKPAMVKLLLEHGADAANCGLGNSAMDIAVNREQPDMIRLLKELLRPTEGGRSRSRGKAGK
jgi:ankyrin repeat protein